MSTNPAIALVDPDNDQRGDDAHDIRLLEAPKPAEVESKPKPKRDPGFVAPWGNLAVREEKTGMLRSTREKIDLIVHKIIKNDEGDLTFEVDRRQIGNLASFAKNLLRRKSYQDLRDEGNGELTLVVPGILVIHDVFRCFVNFEITIAKPAKRQKILEVVACKAIASEEHGFML